MEPEKLSRKGTIGEAIDICSVSAINAGVSIPEVVIDVFQLIEDTDWGAVEIGEFLDKKYKRIE